MSPAELSKAILKSVYWAATKVPTCLFGDHQRLLVQGADKSNLARGKNTRSGSSPDKQMTEGVEFHGRSLVRAESLCLGALWAGRSLGTLQ